MFYIPGYDPIHPRRYRELYRKEGAAQAAISGYDRSRSRPSRAAAPTAGASRAGSTGPDCVADVEVLTWSDIVRTSMATSIPATYGQLVRTAWTYIGSGALRRLMWLRKGPVIAALYPVGMLLLQLAVALGLGLAAAALALAAPRCAGSVSPAGRSVPAPSSSGSRWRGPVAWARAALVQGEGRPALRPLPDARLRLRRPPAAAPTRPSSRRGWRAFADAIATAAPPRLRRGAGGRPFLGRAPRRVDPGRPDPRRAPASGRPGARPPHARAGGADGLVPAAGRPPARRPRAAWPRRTASPGWTSPRPGDGCAFALCDPVAVSGVQPAGRALAADPLGRLHPHALARDAGRRCAGSSSACTSSTSAPSTGPATTTTSASPPVR